MGEIHRLVHAIFQRWHGAGDGRLCADVIRSCGQPRYDRLCLVETMSSACLPTHLCKAFRIIGARFAQQPSTFLLLGEDFSALDLWTLGLCQSHVFSLCFALWLTCSPAQPY